MFTRNNKKHNTLLSLYSDRFQKQLAATNMEIRLYLIIVTLNTNHMISS